MGRKKRRVVVRSAALGLVGLVASAGVVAAPQSSSVASDACTPAAPSLLDADAPHGENNPYLISSAGNLTWIAGLDLDRSYAFGDPNLNKIADAANLRDRMDNHYRQTVDLDVSACEWMPIGRIRGAIDGDPEDEFLRFSGSYDGDGHTVSGMTIRAGSGILDEDGLDDFLGFFSALMPGSGVRDLILSNASISSTTTVENAGLLAGFARNGITVSGVTAKGTIDDGNDQLGGLIGYFNSYRDEKVDTLISDCVVDVNINLTTSGAGYAGGLVGVLRGTDSNGLGGDTRVRDCTVEANITDQEGNAEEVGGAIGRTSAPGDGIFVTRVLASGSITGDRNVGGLIGEVGDDTFISYSASTVDITSPGSGGFSAIGGLVGAFRDGSLTDSVSGGSIVIRSDTVRDIGGALGDVSGASDAFERIYSTTTIELLSDPEEASDLAAFIGDFTAGPTVAANFFLSSAVGDLGATGAGALAGIQASTAAEMKSLSTYTTDLGDDAWAMVSASAFQQPSGPDAQVWGIGSAVNCGYPFLWWQTAPVFSCASPARQAAEEAQTPRADTAAIHLNSGVKVGSPFASVRILAEGEGLASGQTFTVTINPGTRLLASGTASESGYFSTRTPLPRSLSPGSYTLSLVTRDLAGNPLVLSERFAIDSAGLFTEPSADSNTALVEQNAPSTDAGTEAPSAEAAPADEEPSGAQTSASNDGNTPTPSSTHEDPTSAGPVHEQGGPVPGWLIMTASIILVGLTVGGVTLAIRRRTAPHTW